MLVVDENLCDRRILQAITHRYPGQVLPVMALRPGSLIKDEAIPVLLRSVAHPTFVTINVTDFWKKSPAHRSYAIINIALPKERAHEVPGILQQVLRQPAFKTKAARMGKVIHVSASRIQFYEADRRLHSIAWQV
jgi:hypothetical protein